MPNLHIKHKLRTLLEILLVLGAGVFGVHIFLAVAFQNLSTTSNTGGSGSASTPSLSQVTAVGASTTDQVILNGGLTFTSATGTNTTSTNLFATNGVLTNGTVSSLLFTNATGTSATTTNLFVTNGNLTNGTITSLLFTNSTGTSVTTTNSFSTNGTFSSLLFTNGTGTSEYLSGNLAVAGSVSSTGETIRSFSSATSTLTLGGGSSAGSIQINGIGSTGSVFLTASTTGNTVSIFASTSTGFNNPSRTIRTPASTFATTLPRYTGTDGGELSGSLIFVDDVPNVSGVFAFQFANNGAFRPINLTGSEKMFVQAYDGATSAFVNLMTLTNSPAGSASIWYNGGRGSTVTTTGDLPLTSDGNVFIVASSTQVNAISTSASGITIRPGSEYTFVFTSTPTIKHNTAGGAGTARIFLSGSVDLVASANTVLTVVYDGTQWQEKSRKIP